MNYQSMITKHRSRFSKSGLAALGLLLAFLCLPTTAIAQEVRENDTIILKDSGKKLVGKIVSTESDGKVSIRLKNGVKTTIPADKIERVIPRQDAAQAYKSTAASLAKGDAQGHFKLAEWCLDHELFAPASEEISLAISADPDNQAAYLLGVQLETEQIALATTEASRTAAQNRLLGFADKAKANKATSPRIELIKGEVLLNCELPSVAAQSFKFAADGFASADTELDKRLLTKANFLLGKALFNSKKYSDADLILTKVLESQADHFQAILYRGLAKSGLGNFAEAEGHFTRAISIDAVVAEAFEYRGAARLEQNKVNEAIEDYKQAIKLGIPDTRPAYTGLGYCHLFLGKLKSAVNSFVATRGAKLYGPGELGLVLVKISRSEYQAGLDRLAKLDSRIPRSPLAIALKGICKLHVGALSEAQIQFEEAMRLGFDTRQGLRLMVDLSQILGKDDRALQWVKYLTVDPVSSRAPDYFRLGRLLLKQGAEDQALFAFESALKAEAGYIPAMNGIGYLAYKQGNYKTAKAYFEQVLQLNDSNVYAKRALKNILESETRKVWKDSFNREGPEVTNNWESKVGFGIDVELKDKVVSFFGRQNNEDFGKTLLTRKVDDGEFVRMEALINTSGSGESRTGIRVTARGGEAILFRDERASKLIGGFRKSIKAEVTLIELGPWPGDKADHTLTIEIEDDKTGLVAFSIDDERRGECLVPSLRRLRSVDCSVYGQAELNKGWSLKLKQVRIFVRKKAKNVKKKDPKGGY